MFGLIQPVEALDRRHPARGIGQVGHGARQLLCHLGLLAAACCGGALVCAPLASAQEAAGGAGPTRPSIVLILTDDEDRTAHAHMPRTKALLEAPGTRFDNYFVTYSFCAPSRATLLRGQYAHNHRIEGNRQPSGSYAKFEELGLGTSTVATWLQKAGYHTALVGKYVNGYEASKHPPAPGWDHWFGTENSFYHYKANRNGEVLSFGSTAKDYLTDVLAEEAVGVIRQAAAAGQPFFLHVTPFAPQRYDRADGAKSRSFAVRPCRTAIRLGRHGHRSGAESSASRWQQHLTSRRVPMLRKLLGGCCR